MLTLKKIAITGGISCGKSTVSHILSKLGAKVVDADTIVHEQLKLETPLGKRVVDLLGQEIISNGQLDRAKIARKVFNHPTMLRSLEKILHPVVYEEIDRQFEKAKEQKNFPLFAADIPLLFESGRESDFDDTITVIADKEKCWERFRHSTGYEREEFNRRMARQMDPYKKADKSAHVIQNNGTLQELEEKVKTLFKQLTQK